MSTPIAIGLGVVLGVIVGLLAYRVLHTEPPPLRCCESDPPAACYFDDDGQPLKSFWATYAKVCGWPSPDAGMEAP